MTGGGMKPQSGQGLVEYGLIIFLFAVFIMAVVMLIRPHLGIRNGMGDAKAKDICLAAGYPGYEYSSISETFYCTSSNGAVPISAVQG